MKWIELENSINSITDTNIQIKEVEIRKTSGIQKLILWLAGLSTGLQAFLFNLVTYSKTNGFTTFLFIFSIVCFIYIAVSALYFNKTISLINHAENTNIQKLNYQRMLLLSGIITEDGFSEEIKNDFESRELVLKISSGEYLKKENKEFKSLVKLVKCLNGLVESYITSALIIQFVCVAILLFLK